MKHFLLFFLLISSLKAYSLTVDFKFLNDGSNDQSRDTVVNLGWMTSTALCNDQGLRPLSQLKESSITNDNAHCFDFISGSNRGIDLSIPITTKVLTDTPLSVQFSSYSEGAGSDFQVFNLKVGRTGSFSGGTPSFNTTYTMVNNDQWNFQLDIRAVIAGPLAKEHYVNGILITITPL